MSTRILCGAPLSTRPVTSKLFAPLEAPRAALELGSLALSLPWLATLAPRAGREAQPVMVLPGFLADDKSTVTLRCYLQYLGYPVEPWPMGRNLGVVRMGGYETLVASVLKLYREYGQTVSLIGWSLGGVHAMAVAHRAGYAVREVITLGSPVQTGNWTEGDDASAVAAYGRNGALSLSPKVKVRSIYSRTDGIVPWQRSKLDKAVNHENFEVVGSHVGLGVNPQALYRIAQYLDEDAQ